jgi:hypothetical protein
VIAGAQAATWQEAPQERRSSSHARIQAVAPVALGTGFLVLATYLFLGYRYDIWPQSGDLQWVVRYSGDLKNDWLTSTPPQHWVLVHALGVLPHSVLPGVVKALWIASGCLLWASILTLAKKLGASVWTGIAVGLVLIPTGMGGFGISEALHGFFYVTTVALALSLVGLALLVERRFVIAGVAMGSAILLHPGLGPLVLAATLPWVAFDTWRDPRSFLAFATPAVLIGSPAIVQLSTQVGGPLDSHELYGFLGIVRAPHHLLYSFFPAVEWTRTVIWTLAAVVGLWVLRAQRAARMLGVILAAIAVICAAGAVSSADGGTPLILFLGQTSRLSAYVPVFGALLAGGALYTLVPPLAAPAIATAFLIAPRLVDDAGGWFPSLGRFMSVSAAEASVLLGALLVALILRRMAWVRSPAGRKLQGTLALGATVACAVSLLVLRDDRRPAPSPADIAWRDVSDQSRRMTPPGTIVLTPPGIDGFRSMALRPTVVDFGSIVTGDGYTDWRRRLLAVTGDPRILSPQPLGTDLAARGKLVDAGYQRVVASTPRPICTYGARYVVAPQGLSRQPPWLERAYANAVFVLYRVRANACP